MPAGTNTTASRMANAHTAALGSLITFVLSGVNMFDAFYASDHPARVHSTHKTSILPLRLSSTYNLSRNAVMKRFGDFEFDDCQRHLRTGGHPVRLSAQ